MQVTPGGIARRMLWNATDKRQPLLPHSQAPPIKYAASLLYVYHLADHAVLSSMCCTPVLPLAALLAGLAPPAPRDVRRTLYLLLSFEDSLGCEGESNRTMAAQPLKHNNTFMQGTGPRPPLERRRQPAQRTPQAAAGRRHRQQALQQQVQAWSRRARRPRRPGAGRAARACAGAAARARRLSARTAPPPACMHMHAA